MSTFTLPGHDLSLADQHCIALAIKMDLLIARNMAPDEARAYLTRQQYSGPHKSGVVVLSSEAVEEVLSANVDQRPGANVEQTSQGIAEK